MVKIGLGSLVLLCLSDRIIGTSLSRPSLRGFLRQHNQVAARCVGRPFFNYRIDCVRSESLER